MNRNWIEGQNADWIMDCETLIFLWTVNLFFLLWIVKLWKTKSKSFKLSKFQWMLDVGLQRSDEVEHRWTKERVSGVWCFVAQQFLGMVFDRHKMDPIIALRGGPTSNSPCWALHKEISPPESMVTTLQLPRMNPKSKGPRTSPPHGPFHWRWVH